MHFCGAFLTVRAALVTQMGEQAEQSAFHTGGDKGHALALAVGPSAARCLLTWPSPTWCQVNRNIGNILGAGPTTVKKQLERLYGKPGVQIRVAVASRAMNRMRQNYPQ